MKSDTIIRNIVLGLVFLIPALLPILVTSSLFFPFIAGKGFFFRGVVEVSTLLWLILALRNPEYRPKYTHLFGAVLSFVGVIFLADVFGVNAFKSFWSNFERMEGFFFLLHLCAYFIVTATMLSTTKLWDRFFHGWMGTGLFLSLYGTIQLAGELKINQGGTRVDGTLGNAAYFASLLLFVVFFSLLYAVSRHKDRLALSVQTLLWGGGLFVFHAFYNYFGRSKEAAAIASGTKNVPSVDFFLGPIHQYLFLVVIAVGCAIVATIFFRRQSVRAGWVALGVGAVTMLGLFLNLALLKEIGALLIGIGIVSLLVLCAVAFFRERLSEKTNVSFFPYCTYALVGIYALLLLGFTETRGAMLGTVAGIGLTLFLVAFVERKDQILRKTALALLVFFAVVIGVFIAARDSQFVQNNSVLSRLASISLQEGSTRFTVWNMAWEGFKERPLLGYGQENFNYVFNTHYNPALYAQEQWFDRTHNIFFDWLIAGGALGLLGYLSLFTFALYYIWRKGEGWWSSLVHGFRSLFSHDEEARLSRSEKAVLTGLLGAYFVQNIFVFDNVVSYALFFTVLAYVHHLYAQPSARWERIFITASARKDVIVSSALIAFFIAFYFFVWSGVRTGQELINALRPHKNSPVTNLEYFKKALRGAYIGRQEVVEQLAIAAPRVRNLNVDPKVKEEMYTLAVREIGKETKRNPQDARLKVFTGSFYISTNEFGKARVALEEGLKLSPNKQSILIPLGSLYLESDPKRAFELLKKAYEVAPEYADAEEAYLVGLIYAKHFDEFTTHMEERYKIAKENKSQMTIELRVMQALAGQGKFSELARLLEKAIELSPKNFDFRTAIALAYYELGRSSEAVKSLEIAKGIDPTKAPQLDQYITDIKAGRRP